MLPNTLVTNEVKNSAGTEIEFSRISSGERNTVFAQIGEAPAFPLRLTIGHQETGTGLKKRRRSVVRFDHTVESTVDSATPVTISGYQVLDSPIGALVANTEVVNLLANLNSFLCSTGATTAILFDGSGNGSAALLNGTL